MSDYGKMELVELFRDRIRIRFDKQGARRMGVRQMEVSFEAPNRLDELRSGLRQCFGGFDYYVDRVV